MKVLSYDEVCFWFISLAYAKFHEQPNFSEYFTDIMVFIQWGIPYENVLLRESLPQLNTY